MFGDGAVLRKVTSGGAIKFSGELLMLRGIYGSLEVKAIANEVKRSAVNHENVVAST